MRALSSRLMGHFRAPGFAANLLLGLYAVSGWSYPPLNHMAILGLWVILLTQPAGRTWIRQHPLSRYWGFFIVLIGALSIRGMIMHPTHLPYQMLETAKWLLIPGFMAVAFGMAAEAQRIMLLWCGLLAGLMAGLLAHAPMDALLHFDVTFERQPKFQFSRAGMVGLASSIALLALVLLLPRISLLERRFRLTAWILWGLSSYLTVFMLLASQSRISWLALVLVVPCALLILGRNTDKEHTSPKSRWSWLILLLLGLMIAGGTLRNLEGFKERMGKDWTFIAHQIRGDSQKADQSASFTLRSRIFQLGIVAIEQHPWLGWGNVGTSYIASLTGDEAFKIPDVPEGGERLIWITHLHSTYLEILARYGVAGFLLFAWGFVLWTRALRDRADEGLYPRELLIFLGGTAGIMAIWDLTEYRASMEEWRILFSMLAASTFTRPRRLSDQATSNII